MSLQPFDAKRIDSHGGQLDRQCQSVELATDVRHDRRDLIRQFEGLAALRCSFDEQLDSGKLERLRGIQPERCWRNGKARQSADTLTTHHQRFSTGYQQSDAASARQYAIRTCGDGVDDVFAAIEEQQQLAIRQKLAQRVHGARELASALRRYGHSTWQQLFILDCRQIDEPNPIRKFFQKALGDRDRDCCLADAAGADDRYEA
ncbi:MAG TPA: hypothetical protein VIU34_05235 [Steroidobacter sp.]